MAQKNKQERTCDRLTKQLDKLLAKIEKKGCAIPPIGCPPVGGEDSDLPIFCPVNFEALGIEPAHTSLWASAFTLRYF